MSCKYVYIKGFNKRLKLKTGSRLYKIKELLLTKFPCIKDVLIILLAEWQNGYAEDCKSFYVGSIPALASNKLRQCFLHLQNVVSLLMV
jgi:hypothetical protein